MIISFHYSFSSNYLKDTYFLGHKHYYKWKHRKACLKLLQRKKRRILDGKNEDYIEIDEEFYNLFKGANTFNCFLLIKRSFFLHFYF